MLRVVRRVPFFKILAIARLALVARRHLRSLSPIERRRLAELVRRGHHLTPAERSEVRALVARLEPGAFVGAVADAFSPVRLPGAKARRR